MTTSARQRRPAKTPLWRYLLLPLLLLASAIILIYRQLAGGQAADYELKPFLLSRRVIVDAGRVGQRQHRIMALIEVDVTEPRRRIREHKEQSGESLSFTAFVLACLGKAIEENKYFHARRDIWGRLILFDDVDCTTMIEIELQGQKFPLAHIIRGINRRSLHSIHAEIRDVQANPERSGSLERPRWMMAGFLLLPAFVRDIFYGVVARAPRLFKQQAGTVMVTAVGMFGSGSGWGIGTGSIYTTLLLLGGIAEKPGLVDGRIAAREYLGLTVEVDHDIIDGAPAARFVSRLKALLEAGYGLDEIA
jgi:pyruvate/2-oxoglutarate dehydrogenase complex dihydrolipoamide acyltransferase (E2) component